MSHNFDVSHLVGSLAPVVDSSDQQDKEVRISPVIFYEELGSRANLSSMSGADVFKILLEEADFIPTEQFIETKEAYFAKLKEEFDKEQAKPEITKNYQHIKHLKDLNIFGGVVTVEMLANITAEIVALREDRQAVLQNLQAAQERFNDEFMVQALDGKNKIDLLKTSDLYDTTDAYVDDDPLLFFAQDLSKLARESNKDSLRACIYSFERLVRFMFISFYNPVDKEE